MRVINASRTIVAIVTIAVFGYGASMPENREAVRQTTTISDSRKVVSKGVELKARLENDVYISGDPILLRLSVKNNAKELLLLYETYPTRDYKFDVRNGEGENVPLTKDAKEMLKNDAIYRQLSKKLEPGKKAQHRLVLSRIYKMTFPGKYSITVSRKVFDQEGKLFAEAVSNTVKVTVVR